MDGDGPPMMWRRGMEELRVWLTLLINPFSSLRPDSESTWSILGVVGNICLNVHITGKQFRIP